MRVVSFLAVTAAVAISVSACRPADTQTTAGGPDAVAADGAAAQSAAVIPASADTAETFVRDLYANLETGPAPLGVEALWSEAAWAEMEAYQATESGGFNSDPLCNCQDPFQIVIRDLAVTETSPDRADAAVTITQGEAQTSMVLNLIREAGAWRIDNITREGDPTFRDELAQWTAEAEAAS
ncbi:DUF3828 domain-containing protein [Brevundimonas lutea]|uniref:DUF3828 domain-containing protein n=1 Tax=Brevundimonas lutea TaxID=2293980 RepID=UPI000F019895|nr:DUF3828 domain-containing protein [Brevundimonas lutea]